MVGAGGSNGFLLEHFSSLRKRPLPTCDGKRKLIIWSLGSTEYWSCCRGGGGGGGGGGDGRF